MAATEVLAPLESWTSHSAISRHAILHSSRTTGSGEQRVARHERVLFWRLSQVAHAWVELRTARADCQPTASNPRRQPLLPIGTRPKTINRRPTLAVSLPNADHLDVPTGSDALARSRPLDSPSSFAQDQPDAIKRKRRRDSDLLGDTTVGVSVDFTSEEGFLQAAKKKKAAAKQKVAFSWGDDGDDGAKKEDGDGTGDGNNGNGDSGGGDAGSSGGGDGGDGNGDDKKGDDKKDEDSKEEDKQEEENKPEEETPLDDDGWATFAPVGKKSKGKKTDETKAGSGFGLPSISPSGFDFQEIKLDDAAASGDTGSSAPKVGFGAWGSSWNTGNTWSFTATDNTKTKAEPVVQSNPWSIDRPKPKKKEKTSFSWGSFDATEEAKPDEPPPTEESKDLDDFWRTPTTKKDKKKEKSEIADLDPDPRPDPEAEPTSEAAPDDAEERARLDAAAAAEAAEDDAALEALRTKKKKAKKNKLGRIDQEELDRLETKVRLREEAKAAREAEAAEAASIVEPEPSQKSKAEAETDPTPEPTPEESPKTGEISAEEQARWDQEDAEIADEEAALELLKEKKLMRKSGKLLSKDQKEFDRLTESLERRYAERASRAPAKDEVLATTAEAEPVPRVESEPEATSATKPSTDEAETARLAAEEQERKDREAADIAEEEAALELLKEKKLMRKNGKLLTKDQKEFDRLTESLERRYAERAAREAAELEIPAAIVEPVTAPELESEPTPDPVPEPEPELEATSPATEATPVVDAEEQALREVEDIKNEADQEALEVLRAKKVKKGKLSSKDQREFDRLTAQIQQREDDRADRKAAVAKPTATPEADPTPEIELEPVTEPEAASPAPKATAVVDEEEQALRDVEDAENAADEASLEVLRATEAEKGKLNSKQRKTFERLTARIQQRKDDRAAREAAAAAASPSAEPEPEAQTNPGPVAEPEPEPEPVVESPPAVTEAEQARLDAEAAEIAEEVAALAALQAKKAKTGKLTKKDQTEFDRLTANAKRREAAQEASERAVQPEADTQQANDAWGDNSWGATSKKDKEADAEPECKTAEDDFWGSLTTKKDKKKASIWDTPVEEANPAKDDWTSGWGAVSKKSEAKEAAPEPEPEASKDEEDFWGSISTKKDKKKSKEKEPEPQPEPEMKPNDDIWDFGTTSKKDKKKKGSALEVSAEDNADIWGKGKSSKEETKADNKWLDWGQSDKKTTDALIDLDKVEDPPATGLSAKVNSFFTSWTTGADKKVESLKPDTIEEPGLDSWGLASSSKKKKSSKTNTPVEIVEATNLVSVMPDSVEEIRDENDWDDFGGSKKKKKGKLGSVPSSPPPLAPSPPRSNDEFYDDEPEEAETTAPEAKNVWGDEPSDVMPISNGQDDAAAEDQARKDAEAAEIAEEEAALAALKAKKAKAKKGKLGKSDQTELDRLEANAKRRRAAQEAAAEAEAEASRAAEEKAAREPEEQAAREADEQAAREAEEQAAREAEEQARKEEEAAAAAADEAAVEALEKKKNKRGGKLLKKDQAELDRLQASLQQRADEKTALEAESRGDAAAREAEEAAAQEEANAQADRDRTAEELGEAMAEVEAEQTTKTKDKKSKKSKKSLDPEPHPAADPVVGMDNMDLSPEEVEKLLSDPKDDPFSFWGASKKATAKPKADKRDSLGTDASASQSKAGGSDEITPDKLHEATVAGAAAATALTEVWKDTSSPARDAAWPSSSKSMGKGRKPVGGKIADRLKAFGESVETEEAPVAELSTPAPPPPPAAPAPTSPAPTSPEDKRKSSKKSKGIAIVDDAPRRSKSELPGSFPLDDEEDENAIVEIVEMSPPKSGKKSKKSSSKVVDVPPPPPPPPAPLDDNAIVEIVDMAPRKEKSKKKDKKSSSSSKDKVSDAPPPPPPFVPMAPPPPPAVSDAPPTPPPEHKSAKKDRPRINREGLSWGAWTATPKKEEKKSSSKSKDKEREREREKEPSARKKRSEREDKTSSKGSGSQSDKAEKSERERERSDRVKSTPKPLRMPSVFTSTPPVSRSVSTREKRATSGKSSSRRQSVDMAHGIVSPPPEMMPDLTTKAAKILGVGESGRRRKSKAPDLDDDIVMVEPERSDRRRSKQYHHDEDIVMVDVGDVTPVPPPTLRRSNTSGSARKGFSSLFGGISGSIGAFGGILGTPKTEPRPELRPELRHEPRSEPRPEPRRRNTVMTTDDEGGHGARGAAADDGGMTDPEAEARRAARRARRAQKEAAERAAEEARRAKDEARREKRRRLEEAEEARRQEEREARRAERRAAREREEAERRAAEEKEAERQERRRRRKEREAAAAATADGHHDTDGDRRARHHHDHHHEAHDDEDRRRRRAARRAAREAELMGKDKERPSRRHSEKARPSSDDYVYPRSKEHRKSAAWPHSGTSSWVKDHSDAPPPPEEPAVAAAGDILATGEDEESRRRRAKRRSRYGDVETGDDDEQKRRRARKEERERESRRAGSDGNSDERRGGTHRGSVYMGEGGNAPTPRSSWWKKLTGS